jgi:hypothetical protein
VPAECLVRRIAQYIIYDEAIVTTMQRQPITVRVCGMWMECWSSSLLQLLSVIASLLTHQPRTLKVTMVCVSWCC